MKILKTLLFLLFSVFLVFRSWELFFFLIKEGGLSFLEIFIWTFLLNLFVTGVFAFPSFVLPLYKLLPKGYYEVRHPKRVTLFYNLLGVSVFKFLLLFFFWGRGKNRSEFFDGSKSGLTALVVRSKQAESGHLLPAIILCVLSLVLIINGLFLHAVLSMSINFIGNVYPVVLQRKLRIRTQKLQ